MKDEQKSPLRIEYLLCGFGIGFNLGLFVLVLLGVGVK
jgi:hypothetical protein